MRETKRGVAKLFWALMLLLAFLLNACDGEETLSPTATSGFSLVSGQPIAINLTELAKAPTLYEGDYLQLTGAYDRLPVLVCAEDIHKSPPSWGISGDSLQALASGFETQLRALVAEGDTIAVAGHWLRWKGLVGCGQRAREQEIWYLEVEEILSPPILGQIAELQPAGGAQEEVAPSPAPTLEQVPTPDLQPTPSPTAIATEPSPTGTVEPPTRTPFVTTTLPSGSFTPPASMTPATPVGTGTPTPATASSTPMVAGTTSGRPTPTGSASATATVASTTGTPRPTATSPSVATATTGSPMFTIASQGALSTEELVGGSFAANTIHAWTFAIGASETITVFAAGSANIDTVLAIADASGNTVADQNVAPAGVAEQIAGLVLANAGEYQIRVRSQSGASGSYALMLLFSDSYSFIPKDIISYGASATAALAEENDHFWYFNGQSGESVTITLQPNDDSDLFIELYGTDGTNLTGFVDDGVAGDPEVLTAFVLPDSGVFSIRVGEYDFNASNYRISLSGG